MLNLFALGRYALLGFVPLLLAGCNDGALGISGSVAESRQRQVFLRHYTPSVSTFTFAGVPYRIQECWVEQTWTHRGWNKMVIDPDKYAGYNFVVRVTPSTDQLWGIRFQSVTMQSQHLSSTASSLWSTTYGVPPDTLAYRLMLSDSTPTNQVIRFYKHAR
ncbi:hypothetical protein FY528_12860 [Hymenobacter lutimineralis]|uniref:Uncharacterized protein n=1 Tax=Hymenobacter lutimineralis TaxID=2606448 RepID=A0A5D6UZD3_9BACT|nr:MULTISPECIES: hypothetical protein [Hymenobacter]QIX59776.1 hypothetical protein HER32_00640 [Hymenobacter sp. BT18]TYZ08337.1 hypothetical protein FY528_12860 [Hymenobacter lutimineralis]